MDGGVLADRLLVKGQTFTTSGREKLRRSRLRYIAGRESDQCMDLVNVMARKRRHARLRDVQPRSNLFQLESLILAQSERWRQA